MPETNETIVDVHVTPGRVEITIIQPNSQLPTKDTTRSDLAPPFTENRVWSRVKRVFEILEHFL